MSNKPKITRAARLRLAKSAWDWEPHYGQKAVLLDSHPNKIVVCGRRWGKTESGAIDDVTSLLLEEGFGCMVVAPSRDQVLINYREAKSLLEKCPDFRGIYKCRETPHPEITIDAPEGQRYILYRTAGDDGKYIRGHGKKIRRIRVDEAAYVNGTVLVGVIEPMRLDHGAELILQGTPFGKNYFYERFRQGDARDKDHYKDSSQSFYYPSATNPHLQAWMLDDIKQSLGEDSLQWRCEYLAQFVDSAGSVFPWDLIESCFYDPNPEGKKPFESAYNSYFCGIDLARYSDYTVVSVAGFDRGMCCFGDMDRFNVDDWTAQKSRIYDKVHQYSAMGAIDATGEGDAVSDDLVFGEYVGDDEGRVKQRPGLKLTKVRIESNTIKRDLIDKLKLRMQNGLIKIPYPSRDVETGDDRWNVFVDEFKYYTYTFTNSGRVTFAADVGHHDDCVMSAALLVSKAYGQFEKRNIVESYEAGTWGALMEELGWGKDAKADGMRIRPGGRAA